MNDLKNQIKVWAQQNGFSNKNNPQQGTSSKGESHQERAGNDVSIPGQFYSENENNSKAADQQFSPEIPLLTSEFFHLLEEAQLETI